MVPAPPAGAPQRGKAPARFRPERRTPAGKPPPNRRMAAGKGLPALPALRVSAKSDRLQAAPLQRCYSELKANGVGASLAKPAEWMRRTCGRRKQRPYTCASYRAMKGEWCRGFACEARRVEAPDLRAPHAAPLASSTYVAIMRVLTSCYSMP
jgi:hypothetical protein